MHTNEKRNEWVEVWEEECIRMEELQWIECTVQGVGGERSVQCSLEVSVQWSRGVCILC